MKNEDVYVAEISKFIFIIVSETAAAHPAAELAGHPRRRRIKMETGS
jgi:hypothetical protein